MSNKERKPLLPKLRFPEFQNGSKWKIKTLQSLAIKVTVRNNEGDFNRVLTNSAVGGVVDQRDYFDKEIANQSNLENYFIIDEGDYVYNPRVSVTAPVGPISKNKIGKGVISPLYTVFRFKNQKNDFFEQFFKTNIWHDYLKSVSNTGARHDRMSISTENFMKMPLPSSSESEQQKIADCLSSLDDLITAEDKKLEAFKAHKKGLMKKLFPAVDETVPEWRFQEFRERGDWVKRSLREVGQFIRGFSYSAKDTTEDNTKLLIIRSNNIIPMGKTDYNNDLQFVNKNCKEDQKLILGDITICMANGSSALVGKASFYDGKYDGDITVGAFCGIFRSSFPIVRYLFQSDLYKKMLQFILQGGDGAIANLKNDDVLNLLFFIPSLPEQQKIADCLSPLDDIITAQAEKIELLKVHKKALMQGLFPSIGEVEA